MFDLRSSGLWPICLVIKVVSYPLSFTPWLLYPIYFETCITFTPWHYHMTFTSLLIITYTIHLPWHLSNLFICSLYSIALSSVISFLFIHLLIRPGKVWGDQTSGWFYEIKGVVYDERGLLHDEMLTVLWLRGLSSSLYRTFKLWLFHMISESWHDFIGWIQVFSTMWDFEIMMFEIVVKRWVTIISWAYLPNYPYV